MEKNSRNDILLKERVEQVDDINFDKTFDVQEMASRELDNFDKEVIIHDNFSQIHNLHENSPDELFSIEIQPNEFFDSLDLSQNEKQRNAKFAIKNKPLFFAFTSIAIMLCILFIYNLFVINSLRFSLAQAPQNTNSTITRVENDYILFENEARMTITYHDFETPEFSQTNWFDSFVNDVSELFGGSHKK